MRRALPSSAEEGWREAPGWCWMSSACKHDELRFSGAQVDLAMPLAGLCVSQKVVFVSELFVNQKASRIRAHEHRFESLDGHLVLAHAALHHGQVHVQPA